MNGSVMELKEKARILSSRGETAFRQGNTDRDMARATELMKQAFLLEEAFEAMAEAVEGFVNIPNQG
jgi:hypothetical protein